MTTKNLPLIGLCALVTATSAHAATSSLSGLTTGADQIFNPVVDFPAPADSEIPGSFADAGVTYPWTSANSGGFPFWTGFGYSELPVVVDQGNPAFDAANIGFSNGFFRAITGSGNGDAIYGIAEPDEGGFTASPNDGGIFFDEPAVNVSMAITNTSYTYFALQYGADSIDFGSGNPDNGFVTKYADPAFLGTFSDASGLTPFGVGDFFSVTATGLRHGTIVGSSTFNLGAWVGDASTGEFVVVDDWETWAFGFASAVDQVTFTMDGTDTTDFGFGPSLNTPSTFAFDDVTFTAVPEPAFGALLLGLICLLAVRR